MSKNKLPITSTKITKTVDVSKTIEQNTSKTIKTGKEKYSLTYINNLLV